MKDKFSKFSLPLLWLFAFIVIIFMMTLTVNAESSNPLPFIVTNENTSDYDSFNAIFRTKMGYSIIDSPDGSFGYDFYEGGRHYYTIYIPSSDSSYSFSLSADYVDFDITQNRCDLTLSGSWRCLKWHNAYGGLGFYGSDGYVSNINITFFNGSNKGDGNTLVPNISTVNFNYDDDIYQCVFGFGNPVRPIIPTGHATAPGSFDSPVYDTGHAQPSQVPNKPNINNYSWTTHNNPSIDTTNLESLIQSLINIVVYNFNYLFTNFAGLFNNLISNISAFFSYIGQVFEYYGNLIISNIQNLITTFYNNMVSLVEGIGNMINYIIEPVDSSAINNAFTSTNFYGVKNQFVNTFNTFDSAFDIAEPDTFTIIINIQNIRTLYNFGCHSPVTINLGQNFLPIRTALRTFLWVLVAFGSVFVVEHGLSNWIRGERKT